MRISAIPPKERYSAYVHTKNKTAASAPLSTRTDSVEFSGEAKAFGAVLLEAKKAIEASDVNTQRVAELKRDIDSGTYQVPGFLVAQRILDY